MQLTVSRKDSWEQLLVKYNYMPVQNHVQARTRLLVDIIILLTKRESSTGGISDCGLARGLYKTKGVIIPVQSTPEQAWKIRQLKMFWKKIPRSRIGNWGTINLQHEILIEKRSSVYSPLTFQKKETVGTESCKKNNLFTFYVKVILLEIAVTKLQDYLQEWSYRIIWACARSNTWKTLDRQ